MPEPAHASKGDHEAQSVRARAKAPPLPAPDLEPLAPAASRLGPGLLAGDGLGPPALRVSLRERQAFAAEVSRLHGNRHLGRMIAGFNQAPVQRQSPPSAPAAAPGALLAPLSTGEALRARAQEVLSNTFGYIKKIVPGRVEVLDQSALRQRFDDMHVRKGTINPKTGQPWEAGGSALVFQTLEGFADRAANAIYVAETPGGGVGEGALATTVHEMLHTNAAGDWASTVGAAIDEGETEILAMKACKFQQVPITPGYAAQRASTEQLVPVVGAHTLEQAYFGGVSILAAAVEAVLGEGKWEQLRAAIREGDRDKFDKLLRARNASDWAKEKIRTINAIIDSWWVTDADIARIEGIIATASQEDRMAISAAVTPRLSDLSSHGQRARLRIALGG